MTLTLIVLNGSGKGRVFHLDGDRPEVVGRQAGRLRVIDSRVSRQHAEIRCENQTWIIRDLGSTNGTWVNGRRLTGLTELEEGDQVQVGRVKMVVGQLASEPDHTIESPADAGSSATGIIEAPSDDVAGRAAAADDDDADLIDLNVLDPASPAALSDASNADSANPMDDSVHEVDQDDPAEAGYLGTPADLMELAGFDDDANADLPGKVDVAAASPPALDDDAEDDAVADSIPSRPAAEHATAESAAAGDDDPLAALARENQTADRPADDWPDLDLELDLDLEHDQGDTSRSSDGDDSAVEGADAAESPAKKWVMPDVPTPSPSAEDAPQAVEEAAAPSDATVPPFAETAPTKPSNRRLVGTVVVVMLLVVGAAGMWYAIRGGWVDQLAAKETPSVPAPIAPMGPAEVTPTDLSVPDAPGNEPAPASTESPVAEAAAPPATEDASDDASETPLLEAAPQQASVSESDLQPAPPSGALSDAPRLLGASVLANRVARPTRSPGSPGAPEAPGAASPAEETPAAPPDDAANASKDGPAPISDIDVQSTEQVATRSPDTLQRIAGSGPSDTEAAATTDAPASPDANARSEPIPVDSASAATAATSRVAFLVDASGSLLDSLDDVLEWLGVRINSLDRSQQFTVVFFNHGESIEVPPAGLRPATHQAKRQVRQWIAPAEGNVIPSGRSDPLPTLRLALSYGVNEIVILSDDSFSANMTRDEAEGILSRIDNVVAGHDVTIHTVQFFYDDPHHVLRSLAQQHNGTYHFVRPDRPTGPDPLGMLQNLSAGPADDASRAQ